MPVVTSLVIAGAGLAVAGAGAYKSNQAAKANQSAQEEVIRNQQAAEESRKQQMNLDAMRRRREIVRQSIAARSVALATTTAQGASGGSALPGAYGGVSGRSNVNDLGVRQNQQLGNDIFASNQGVLGGYRMAAQAQTQAAIGAGLTSIGGAILRNQGSIAKVGNFAAGGFGLGGNAVDVGSATSYTR